MTSPTRNLLKPADPTCARTVDELVSDGPGADHDLWALELLTRARTLPNELRDLRASAAQHVLTSDADLVNRSWAQLIIDLSDPKTTNQSIADSVIALTQLEAPLHATQAFARLGRRARATNQRALSELLYLASLAACDIYQAVPPLELLPGEPGDDQPAALLAPAVTALGNGAHALADFIEAVGPALLLDGDDLAETALPAATAVLRATSAHGAEPDWLGGSALRGLAFALPPGSLPRFEPYHRYARLRGIHPAWIATFTERWAQNAMSVGRLGAARELLADAQSGLDDSEDNAFAHIQLLRALGRVNRHAGDVQLAKSYSDQAITVMEAAGATLAAADQAGVWINRSLILLQGGDRPGATDCARHAHDLYQSDGFSTVGVVEAREMEIAANPDRAQAAELAAELVAQDDHAPLPTPVRSSALWRCGEALMDTDRAMALRSLDAAATRSDNTGTVVSVEASMSAARALVLEDPVAATPWAARAEAAGRRQHNLRHRARAGLLLARCQTSAEPQLARLTAVSALDDLSNCLVGLSADGETAVLDSVGDDLRAIFDLAVAVDDPTLALRVAELGRAIRLAAMMRLNADELPPAVRAALSETAAATKAAEHASSDESSPHTRAVAVEHALDAADALTAAAGEILRTVTVAPLMDVADIRAGFPFAHLLTLSEHGGVLRWGWWPPGADATPQAGSAPLSPQLEALIDGYAHGDASTFPGDVTAPLVKLLPGALVENLRGVTEPAPLLISPMGRLWHVPFAAIPIGPAQRPSGASRVLLVHKATLTLTPSLRLAHDLAERERMRTPTDGKVAGYCNPNLSGALMEQQSLTAAWGSDYAELDGVHTFGQGRDVAIEVMATHATREPGLAQSVMDHRHQKLSAGNCITRTFSRIVVLGTCHGFGNSDGGTEPIGLLTVVSARGATWVAGGHQHLYDATVGWILARAYRDLRTGSTLPRAIRAAQISYLETLDVLQHPDATTAAGPESELSEIVERAGGFAAAREPWCWSLSVTGPALVD